MKDDLIGSRGCLTTKIVHKASQFSIQTHQTVSHIKTKRLDTNQIKLRPQKIAKVNKLESKIYLTEILLIKTFELHKPTMYMSWLI